jgi:hypothetical protein
LLDILIYLIRLQAGQFNQRRIVLTLRGVGVCAQVAPEPPLRVLFGVGDRVSALRGDAASQTIGCDEKPQVRKVSI